MTGTTWVATMKNPIGRKRVPSAMTKNILPTRVATHDAKGEKGRRPASHKAAMAVDQ
jgi:hypothetical protein